MPATSVQTSDLSPQPTTASPTQGGERSGKHTTNYDVYLGLDVGKTAHHGCALLTDGTKVHDKPLPQDEAQLTALFDQLKTHGTVLLIVDQPNTIGALPVAVARATDCGVAYLPGLAMRKAADLYPGQAKTDPRDAFIIACHRTHDAAHPARCRS